MSLLSRFRRLPAKPDEAAMDWIKQHTLPRKGIAVSSRKNEVYHEVTGYLVPTLLDSGQAGLAGQYVQWLLEAQNPEGWWGLGAKPYAFDTCQVLEALNAALRHKLGESAAVAEAAARALAWLASCIDARGLLSLAHHDSGITAQVHLRGLRIAHALAVTTGHKGMQTVVAQVARNYLAAPAALERNVLSHFYCYELDGWAYFEPRRAEQAVLALAGEQRADGSLEAWPGAGFVCYVGVAQGAILFQQFGLADAATRAIDFLQSIQHRNGGFVGSNGPYFPREEISWGAKFFLDAWHITHSRQPLQALLPVGGGT